MVKVHLTKGRELEAEFPENLPWKKKKEAMKGLVILDGRTGNADMDFYDVVDTTIRRLCKTTIRKTDDKGKVSEEPFPWDDVTDDVVGIWKAYCKPLLFPGEE